MEIIPAKRKLLLDLIADAIAPAILTKVERAAASNPPAEPVTPCKPVQRAERRTERTK